MNIKSMKKVVLFAIRENYDYKLLPGSTAPGKNWLLVVHGVGNDTSISTDQLLDVLIH